MSYHSDPIRVVLFDVGGVLVETTGVPTVLEWMGNRVSPQELWRMWLASPVVRAFETGRTTPEFFADQIIAELQLAAKKTEFLQEFTRGVKIYPGALALLARVPRRFTRATLCNSNALHWPRLMSEMQLDAPFDHHFASHLIGKIKPDEAAFRHVTTALDCKPEEVLFLDDNLVNVESALRVGIRGVQVKGVSAAEQALVEAGILEA